MVTSVAERWNAGQRDAAPVGVGLLGAGLVTQAIHLPTLAGLPEAFTVRKVMDIDPELARDVADRAGADPAAAAAEIMDDPAIDVVVICSPNQLHAEQVSAACAAGKRVVLCEKPLAVDPEDIRQVERAVLDSGSTLVVGAMHVFDPAWTAALAVWDRVVDGAPSLIRSSIVLPPNSRFENWATEPSSFLRPPRGGAGDPGTAVEGGILGLAIHDLPLIRRLLGAPAGVKPVVHSAAALAPFGYAVLLTMGDTVVELTAHLGDRWHTEWTLEALAGTVRMEAGFPPSYVHGGSGRLSVTTAEGTESFGPRTENGYHGEWEAIAAHLGGLSAADAGLPGLTDVIEDIEFAVAVVAGVREIFGEER